MIRVLLIIVFATFVSRPSYAVTNLDGNVTVDSSVRFDGNMSVRERVGEYKTSPGHEITTTRKQLETEISRAESYAGPSEFNADYTINERKDGSFKQGSVILASSDFTWTPGDPLQADDLAARFTTDKIKITAARISDGTIESFKFRSKDWYPETEDGGDAVKDRGLKGKINFVTGAVEFSAAYKLEGDASVDTFKFDGHIVNSVPGVPEASTWAMMLLGFAGVGFSSYRASPKSAAFAARALGLMRMATRGCP